MRWLAAPPGTAAPSRQVRQRDSTLPSRQATTRRRTTTSLPDASFHTLTKRVAAVTETNPKDSRHIWFAVESLEGKTGKPFHAPGGAEAERK